MNILLLGSGGREHALAWKIAASPIIERLYCAPGNAGIAQEAEIVALDPADHAAVIAFFLLSGFAMIRSHGAAPIDYEGPVVTLFGSANAIAGITKATTTEGIDVLGDRTLLKAVARCLGKGASMFAVRAKK